MAEGPSRDNDAPDSREGVLNLSSVKIRKADHYNDQTRDLLQRCLHLMPVDDLQIVGAQLRILEKVEKKLRETRFSIRRFFIIRDYRRVSEDTYLIVKILSNRIFNDQIKDRIRAATDPRDPPSSIPPVIAPTGTPGSPLTSQGRSIPGNVDSSDVDRRLQLRRAGDTSDQRTRLFVAAVSGSPSGPPEDGTYGEGSITSNSLFGAPSEANNDD